MSLTHSKPSSSSKSHSHGHGHSHLHKDVSVSKKWNLLAITYNVANKPPSQQVINQILEATMKNTDLSFVVISLQEIRTAERFGMHWNDTWRELFHIALWNLGFLCIANSYMITNLLLVFANLKVSQLVISCKFSYSKDYYNGAKGTICVLVKMRGDINFVFMGSHFVHATEQVARRVLEAKCVSKLVHVAKKHTGVTSILWAGDLNFRSIGVEADEFSKTVQDENGENLKKLVDNHDQLVTLRKTDNTFNFVEEAPINFMPTYRFIIGSDNGYDLLRVPSWTDRILYKNLHSISYNSVRDCTYSDHQPVYSHLSFDYHKNIKSGWEIEFNEINAWYTGVPLHISFKGKDFWKRNGSFRDWLGVYKIPNVNERALITFTNIMLCVDYGTHYLAEFMSLPPAQYIVAYHSFNDYCIKGMSNLFTVTNFE